MKIRWNQNSIRYRITPTELKALHDGLEVSESLALPGGSWDACLRIGQTSSLTMDSNQIVISLSPADQLKLEEIGEEGVYFKTSNGVRYFIEKDFPCAHPHNEQACEEESERFTPTAEFERRKAATLLTNLVVKSGQ